MIENVGLPPVGFGTSKAVEVTSPFEILVRIGTAVGNTYIGSSMALRTVYLRTHAIRCDRILSTPGGIFWIPDDSDTMFRATTSLSEHHIFEKYWTHRVIWPSNAFKPIPYPTSRIARFDDLASGVRLASYEAINAVGDFEYVGGISDVVVTRFADAVAATFAPPLAALVERATLLLQRS